MTHPQRAHKPKFSVLMANYNNEAYVGHAIQSVMAQTFQDWELVLVDDHSSDDSVCMITPLLTDERIRFFRSETNIGYIATLKRLIKESQSDIIGILDADDALSIHALEEMYKAHVEHPNAGLIYSQFMYCDRDLTPVKQGFSKPLLSWKTILHMNCAAAFRTFKKSFYRKTEGFDDNILYAEDKDLYYKLEEVGGVVFVDKVLYLYRWVDSSQSHEAVKADIGRISHSIAIYYAYKRRRKTEIPNVTRRVVSLHLYRGALFAIDIRDSARAWFCILRAIYLYPCRTRFYVTWIKAMALLALDRETRCGRAGGLEWQVRA